MVKPGPKVRAESWLAALSVRRDIAVRGQSTQHPLRGRYWCEKLQRLGPGLAVKAVTVEGSEGTWKGSEHRESGGLESMSQVETQWGD